jgi:hypothetical protein
MINLIQWEAHSLLQQGKPVERGLMVKSPWIDKILDGEKTWEIRGSRTAVRGPVGLIKSASGKVQGTADIVDVIGPLSLEELQENTGKHRISPEHLTKLPYPKTYAWVLKNPHRLDNPVSYPHPNGAVIWVKLPETVGRKLNLKV